MNHAPLPFPIYVNVNNAALGLETEGVTRGLWHGVHSKPGQVLMCHVMLETGANWSGLSLHAISMSSVFLEPEQVSHWGAMGMAISVTHMPYLEGLSVSARNRAGRHSGVIIDWLDGFAKIPAEHKPLNLIYLETGPIVLEENNRCRFSDDHFVNKGVNPFECGYRRCDKTFWGM